MAVPAIPVLSFRPNWKDGLTESLIWLTDVMISDTGAEQRRSLRIAPGRQFEASFLLRREERTFLDLFLARAANQEMFVPLWHDIGRTTSALAVGVDRLDFDTRWREFAEGGFAMIQTNSALEYEIVEIISVDDGGLDLAAPTTLPWPRGAKVMPLRRGRFNPDDAISYSKYTSRVADSTFRINIVEPNDWAETGMDPLPLHNGYPILTTGPDLSNQIDMQFARMFKALGNDFGKSFYADSADRAFVAQGHSWFLKGRLAQARFRDFLYRARGRTRAFWLPTFNDDLVLASTEVGGSTTFEVNKTGFTLAGGPGPGRDHVAIFLNNGALIIRQIQELQNPSVTSREKIKLSAALGTGISPATVKRISFVDLARLDQDQIDLEHYTDSDGVTTCSAVFRAFGDTRDASGAVYYPIPESEQTLFACGAVPILVNINAQANGADTPALGLVRGITLTDIDPTATILVTMADGGPFIAWSPWGIPSPKQWVGKGSMAYFNVIPDGDTSQMFQVGESGEAGTYDGYAAARAAYQPAVFNGGSSYTFYIQDTPYTDNSGGLSLAVYVGS